MKKICLFRNVMVFVLYTPFIPAITILKALVNGANYLLGILSQDVVVFTVLQRSSHTRREHLPLASRLSLLPIL